MVMTWSILYIVQSNLSTKTTKLESLHSNLHVLIPVFEDRLSTKAAFSVSLRVGGLYTQV